MNYEDIRRIQRVFFDLGSFSRDLYRSVVREKPELNLPGERQIDREFGSFRAFADKIKQKEVEENITNSLLSGVDIDSFKNFTAKTEPIKEIVEAKEEVVVEAKIEPKDSGLFEQNSDWDGKIAKEEVDTLKELIREKRLELFESKLESYHWNPESRVNIFW